MRFRGDIVRRNYILVTLMVLRVKVVKVKVEVVATWENSFFGDISQE